MITIDMNPTLALIGLGSALIAIGLYLMLERSLTRIIVGVSIASNGVNVLILAAGGRAGSSPLNDGRDTSMMADPLVQAFMLTAIVITLSTVAFLLAMAYRTWQLNGNDEVQDDLEDARLARLKSLPERVTDDSGVTLEEVAAQVRDETATDLEIVDVEGTGEGRKR